MTALISWDFDPPGEVIRAFMRSDAFVRGIMGPVGSAKSTACTVEILRRSLQQAPGPDGKRHTRWAVVRNSFPELKTTTIKTWQQWMPAHIGDWREQGPPMHRIAIDNLDCEVLFLALDRPDDIAKILSLEITGAWINEAREIPKAVLDALTGRVGRFPPQRDGGPTWSGILMDTNPPDTDHWWYTLAEENTPEGFAFFRQPAGDGPNAENLTNLPKGYYQRISAGKTAEWLKVYVKGEYGFAGDGKPVYPEYRDGIHCREFELVPKLPLFIGLDFGLTPAAVIAQRKLNGQWLLRDELVAENMGISRFADELGALLRGKYRAWPIGAITGDPAGDQRAQTDEETVFQVLWAKNIEAMMAPSNDFALRRDAVAVPMTRLIDGEPGLLVHPDCRVLRKGMAGAYCYKRVQIAGAERYKDVPDKNHYSHVNDAGQYCLLGAGEGDLLLQRRQERRTPMGRSAIADTTAGY